MNPLIIVIEKHGGSKTALANHLMELYPDRKVTATHIDNWLNRDLKVPPEWIIPLCHTVDFDIKPNAFNAKVYPHPTDGLPEHLKQVA